jgi:hypothetical protein
VNVVRLLQSATGRPSPEPTALLQIAAAVRSGKTLGEKMIPSNIKKNKRGSYEKLAALVLLML